MRSVKVMFGRGSNLHDAERAQVTVRPHAHVRDEAGASLVLALLFLVVIGLIVGGLASWTANDLSNATVFQNARATESP